MLNDIGVVFSKILTNVSRQRISDLDTSASYQTDQTAANSVNQFTFDNPDRATAQLSSLIYCR
jgi:hypothetical protein